MSILNYYLIPYNNLRDRYHYIYFIGEKHKCKLCGILLITARAVQYTCPPNNLETKSQSLAHTGGIPEGTGSG